jgi:uncharacterized protein (UPF0216 family)
MGMEIARINDGVVAGRKSLALLLTEENPTALTRGEGNMPSAGRHSLLSVQG